MDGTIREKICGRVQRLRKQAGLTQEGLAELSTLSVDGIRKIEGCRATPSLETLEKLSQALQMSLSELVRFDVETLTEEQKELQELQMYLTTRKVEEIRLAKRVVRAVIEELR